MVGRGVFGFAVAGVALAAVAVAVAGRPSFTTTPLLRPDGSSETAVAIGASGQAVVTGLSWTASATNTWLGEPGSVPTYVGQFDADLAPGVRAGADADIDLGSTGTLHFTSLVSLLNPEETFTRQLGVAAVTCPGADVADSFVNCTRRLVDRTQADRPWLTSRGSQVWLSYHDAGVSSLVHVQRSDDDGFTWKRVGDPITGDGPTTAGSTFNNVAGPIVADPTSDLLYVVYTRGEAGLEKATTTFFNHVVVARSMDGGETWSSSDVFAAPPGSAEDNFFPALAVDPISGAVYATWSDQAHVYVAGSTDLGATWSTAVAVNASPIATAVEPWVAARDGRVDLVYYGTTEAGNSDEETGASWHVYLARSTDAGQTFDQTQVTSQTNHVGPICVEGPSCEEGTRNLLDLFEVAIDPRSGKATIAYTDDTLTMAADGSPLPQIVLAQEN